jgi:hypothetical protein
VSGEGCEGRDGGGGGGGGSQEYYWDGSMSGNRLYMKDRVLNRGEIGVRRLVGDLAEKSRE